MSLYFKERVEEERIKDPVQNDMITFRFPWIVSIPPIPDVPGTPQMSCSCSFRTSYKMFCAKWKYELTNNKFKVEPEDLSTILEWNGSCYFSYQLIDKFGTEIYSSSRIALTSRRYAYVTPAGSMKKFRKTYTKRKLGTMNFVIELKLPKLYFDRPFEIPGNCLSFKWCDDYPEDMDSDFRFEFFKDGDFTIKCPDGSVPAIKMVLNVSSSFMKEKFKQSNGSDELIVDHSIDVVKPIITYFHSRCFEMPSIYNLDYADRLLKAINFFIPEWEQRIEIKPSIYVSLSQKFVKDPHDFDSIIQWASLASRYSIPVLSTMVSTTIAHKYFYEWLERFPENTRNIQNQIYRDILLVSWELTSIYIYSFFTETIID